MYGCTWMVGKCHAILLTNPAISHEWGKVRIVITTIKVITKLPNSEQSYKGKVKTHMYINRQNQSTTGNCENRNDPDLVQAFPKKWWVESDFKVPNLPLSLRLKVSGCHYNSIYNNTWKKQIKQLSKQHQAQWSRCQRNFYVIHWYTIIFDIKWYDFAYRPWNTVV